MNNRDRLIEQMSAHAIDRHELAAMLHVDRDTIDRWLLTRESTRWIEVPDMAIELLAYKIADRERAGQSGD